MTVLLGYSSRKRLHVRIVQTVPSFFRAMVLCICNIIGTS